MSKTTVGLDIGTSSVKLMELKETSSGIEVLHLALSEFPPELKGRERKDPYWIAALIKELFQEAGIKKTEVITVVSGPEVGIRRMILPPIPREELRAAISWEGGKCFPFPLDKAIIDYHLLGEVSEGEAKKLALLAVAARPEAIDQELSILNFAGLTPKGIEVTPFALWNILQRSYPLNERENIALLDLGAEETGVLIFKGQVLQFTREIFTGSNSLTQAIASTLPEESWEKAEEIKRHQGISREASFFPALRPPLERMVAEVERSFDFYRTQVREEKIARVLISGGGAELKGLPEFLENSLGIPVEVFNPFAGPEWLFKGSPFKTPAELSPRMVVVAGLALSRARDINLLPPEIQRAKKERWQKILLFGLLPVIVSFVIFFLYFRENSLAQKYKATLAQRKAEMAGLSPQLAKISQLETIKRDMESRKALYPSLASSYPPFSRLLREIGQKLPENATLVSLSVEKSTATLEVSPKEKSEGKAAKKEIKSLRLKGNLFGPDEKVLSSLARLLTDLESSPHFSEVKLVSTEEENKYNKAGARFEVLCHLRSGA